MTYMIAAILMVVGAALRIVPHPHNAVPIGALALYAGARLPRRWAWIVPVGSMVLADLVIDRVFYPQYRINPLGAVRLVNYATFALIALAGSLRPGQAGVPTRVGMSLLASTVFYLASNFAVWAAGEGTHYPHDAAGLLTSYVAGWPFYRNGVMADLLGMTVVFGLDPVRRLARRPAEPVVAADALG